MHKPRTASAWLLSRSSETPAGHLKARCCRTARPARTGSRQFFWLVLLNLCSRCLGKARDAELYRMPPRSPNPTQGSRQRLGTTSCTTDQSLLLAREGLSSHRD